MEQTFKNTKLFINALDANYEYLEAETSIFNLTLNYLYCNMEGLLPTETYNDLWRELNDISNFLYRSRDVFTPDYNIAERRIWAQVCHNINNWTEKIMNVSYELKIEFEKTYARECYEHYLAVYNLTVSKMKERLKNKTFRELDLAPSADEIYVAKIWKWKQSKHQYEDRLKELLDKIQKYPDGKGLKMDFLKLLAEIESDYCGGEA